MNLFKSEFFGIEIIINYLWSLKKPSTLSSLSALLGHSINGLVTDRNTKIVSEYDQESYVVEALFLRYFKLLQPIKLILNIHEIIRGYSWYAKLKYYELQ